MFSFTCISCFLFVAFLFDFFCILFSYVFNSVSVLFFSKKIVYTKPWRLLTRCVLFFKVVSSDTKIRVDDVVRRKPQTILWFVKILNAAVSRCIERYPHLCGAWLTGTKRIRALSLVLHCFCICDVLYTYIYIYTYVYVCI